MAAKKSIMRMKDGDLPKIFIYGFIDADMSEAFVKEIAWLKANGQKEVELYINSKGGDVTDGIAMYNCMRSCGMAIHVFVEGIAASMASVLAFAGKSLQMNRYARMMMHKPSGGAYGNAEQLKATADYVEGLENDMQEIYCKRTGLSGDDVKAQFLNGKDNFFTARQAMDAKLIDGVYDGEEVAIADGEEVDVHMLFTAFQTKIEAKFQYMDNIQIPIDADITRMLGGSVTASSDPATVKAAIKALYTRALKYDTVKTELEAAKKAAVANDVTAQLEAALDAKKITVAQRDVFARQYVENPEDLKTVLDTMGVFTSVNAKIQRSDKQGVYAPEVKALMDKGWDALMQNGEMAKLKGLSAEAYAAMKETRYPGA